LTKTFDSVLASRFQNGSGEPRRGKGSDQCGKTKKWRFPGGVRWPAWTDGKYTYYIYIIYIITTVINSGYNIHITIYNHGINEFNNQGQWRQDGGTDMSVTDRARHRETHSERSSQEVRDIER
jgi:hypothetical protein